MSHGNVVSDDRRLMTHDVNRHIVLQVRELTHLDRRDVTPQDAVKPNIRPFLQGHIADDPCAVGDEHPTGHLRQNALIPNQPPHTFT